jgi:hypothetical protein
MTTTDLMTRAKGTSRRARVITSCLAGVTVLGVLYFFAAVSAEEALRPMYDPVQRTISELAVGRYDFLQISAFVALGLSLLALPAGLWRRLRSTLVSRLGLCLIALGGVASFVAAAFPTDLRNAAVATVSGGYACLITAMLLLSLQFRGDLRWRPIHLPASGLTLAGIAALLSLAAVGNSDITGLVQRLMVVPLLTWVMLTGVQAMRISAAARREAAERATR